MPQRLAANIGDKTLTPVTHLKRLHFIGRQVVNDLAASAPVTSTTEIRSS